MADYLQLDYSYLPCRAKIYKKEVLVKKWGVQDPKELVKQVIDSTDLSGFEKMRMNKTLDVILNTFEPKNIKVIEHE